MSYAFIIGLFWIFVVIGCFILSIEKVKFYIVSAYYYYTTDCSFIKLTKQEEEICIKKEEVFFKRLGDLYYKCGGSLCADVFSLFDGNIKARVYMNNICKMYGLYGDIYTYYPRLFSEDNMLTHEMFCLIKKYAPKLLQYHPNEIDYTDATFSCTLLTFRSIAKGYVNQNWMIRRLLFIARYKNPNSHFYKDNMPLDIFKILYELVYFDIWKRWTMELHKTQLSVWHGKHMYDDVVKSCFNIKEIK